MAVQASLRGPPLSISSISKRDTSQRDTVGAVVRMRPLQMASGVSFLGGIHRVDMIEVDAFAIVRAPPSCVVTGSDSICEVGTQLDLPVIGPAF